MTPGVILALVVLLGAGFGVTGEADPAPPVSEAPRRLVLANFYGLHWSILSGVPTGEVSIFAGSTLRPRHGARGRTWQTALGYELSLSAGGADFFTTFYSFGAAHGALFHRHHFAAMGTGARDGRLFYSFGGGVMLWRSTPVALEADTRLGVVLGVRRTTRVRGVVGGHVRLVGVLGGVPMPHIGVFAGVTFF